jgi:hypothetical protein
MGTRSHSNRRNDYQQLFDMIEELKMIFDFM